MRGAGDEVGSSRQTVAVIAAITCALAPAACTSGGSTPPTPSPTSATSAATATPSTDPAAAAILDSYEAFSGGRVAALAHPRRKSLPKDLTRYGTGKALSDVRATILLFRQQGIELRGKPVLSPEVTDVDGLSATISDCVDSTNWKAVYAATGKSALAAGQSARVMATVTATKPDDRWLITTVTNDRDRTC